MEVAHVFVEILHRITGMRADRAAEYLCRRSSGGLEWCAFGDFEESARPLLSVELIHPPLFGLDYSIPIWFFVAAQSEPGKPKCEAAEYLQPGSSASGLRSAPATEGRTQEDPTTQPCPMQEVCPR